MTFQTLNPATGKIEKTFPFVSDEQVAEAVSLADNTFRSDWRLRTVASRAAIMKKAAALLREREQEFATYATVEMGKLISQSLYEVRLSADILEYYADNGETFLADRVVKGAERSIVARKPLTEVTEKAVPVNGVPEEEKLSQTQPYSTGMPAVRSPLFTEGRTWGLTPLDQLSCRVAFRQARYQGEFTPPGLDWYLPDPSPLGGMNWGGVTVDTRHDYLIVNDMRLMLKARLIPRKNVEEELARTNKMTPSVYGIIPMEETPYGADRVYINSPLGIPCTTPPFGTLTTIDMKTRRIAWQRSMGTPEQFGPLNIRAHLPVEMGMPTLGAGVTTASGLIFYYGASDYYLRAMDSVSGKELWKSPLPVGAQGTPLVYQSQTDGNEYVVVTAGGSRGGLDRGDYIIAYRLSDKK